MDSLELKRRERESIEDDISILGNDLRELERNGFGAGDEAWDVINDELNDKTNELVAYIGLMNMGDELPSKWCRYHEALWLSARLWRALGHSRPRGPEQGQPCLVIPGFLTSDRSALELRRALAEQGYRVYGWDLGVNKGANLELFDALKQRVNEIYDGRPILLVGWSLGGLFAREIARCFPEKILAVVTLGSPISCSLKLNNVWKVYEWITGHKAEETPVPRILKKPPVPTLAIWSKRDGLIPPMAARGDNFSRDDEIEISCPHMAFGLSYVITRKVARVVKEWLDEKNLYNRHAA